MTNSPTNNLVREWLGKASHDLRSAEILIAGDEHANAAFFCQQAAEKAAKGYLVYLDIEFPKTHNLYQLAQLLSEADAELAHLVRDADELTKYAWQVRYPGSYPTSTHSVLRTRLSLLVPYTTPSYPASQSTPARPSGARLASAPPSMMQYTSLVHSSASTTRYRRRAHEQTSMGAADPAGHLHFHQLH